MEMTPAAYQQAAAAHYNAWMDAGRRGQHSRTAPLLLLKKKKTEEESSQLSSANLILWGLSFQLQCQLHIVCACFQIQQEGPRLQAKNGGYMCNRTTIFPKLVDFGLRCSDRAAAHVPFTLPPWLHATKPAKGHENPQSGCLLLLLLLPPKAWM